MQSTLGRLQHNRIVPTPFSMKGLSARTIIIAVAFCVGSFGLRTVHAQAGETGADVGTIQVSGSAIGPKVSYRGSAKVSLPVSSRKADSITAEFLAGEAPAATAMISQWDISDTEKYADSGGQFVSYSCALAAPVEIPMSATGVLDVDLKAKTHALSLTLVSTKDVDFNCKNSRSGAYKKKQGISIYVGTGAPGAHFEKQLPFTDPVRLTAKVTLMPTNEAKGKYGPIVQEWNLQLTR